MSRVEIAPHYDAWMQGDRMGRVVRTSKSRETGKTIAHVKMEVSGRTLKVWYGDLRFM